MYRDGIAGTVIFLIVLAAQWTLLRAFGFEPPSPVMTQTGAAWVQAIGSIVAILVAIWISQAEYRRELNARRETEMRRFRATALILSPLLVELHLRLADTERQLPAMSGGTYPEAKFHAVLGLDILDQIRGHLDRFQDLDAGSAELLFALIADGDAYGRSVRKHSIHSVEGNLRFPLLRPESIEELCNQIDLIHNRSADVLRVMRDALDQAGLTRPRPRRA